MTDTSSTGSNTNGRWPGRSVFITGGTSGTGYQTARKLLALGANVVVNGRDRGRAENALDQLRQVSDRVALSVGDCSDYATAAGVVHEAVDLFGGLDVVVSAGASSRSTPKPFADMTSDEIVEGMMTKFQARMFPVHAAIEHLRGRPGANIVLLTTDAGRHATSGEVVVGAYAASVIQMTKTLAKELSRERIRVNAVSMTLTAETRSWNEIFGNRGFQNALFAKAVKRFPFGAPPTAREVAEAVVFLASDAAGQISGQTLSVNGGLSFGGW